MSAPAAHPVDDLVLDVRGLSAEFPLPGGAVQAVRDVSLTVRRGEKAAIVGESGSGKSALALSILGLLPPPGRVVAGEVRLNGRDVRRLGERRMRDVRGREVALVYQDPLGALDPVRSIGSQLAEAVRRHQPELGRRAVRERVVELLEAVEVPNAARRLADRPFQYSGGMRQRVVIAMAVANDPALLIADEPTTALDVTTQAQILDLLDRLVTEREMAVVLITHNLAVVARFCESVHVMYAGRLVEEAGVRELFARQAHPYTEALLRAAPRPVRPAPAQLVAIPGQPPDLSAPPPGCAFAPRCPVGRGQAVCEEQDPAPQAIGGRVVRCHFAGARLAEGATA